MKKLILLSFLFLCGCFFPQYHSHTQRISFTAPENEVIEVDGKMMKSKDGFVDLSLSRLWFDRDILIKRNGYKDYTLKLTSKLADEKWARYAHWSGSGQISAAELYIFPNTRYFWENGCSGFGECVGGVLFTPVPFLEDIFNMVIGAPSAAIINPWTIYTYNPNVIMEPLDENEKLYNMYEQKLITKDEYEKMKKNP